MCRAQAKKLQEHRRKWERKREERELKERAERVRKAREEQQRKYEQQQKEQLVRMYICTVMHRMINGEPNLCYRTILFCIL